MKQENKYKTEHTEHVNADEAPSYMEDFINPEPLFRGEKKLNIPDTSIDAIIKEVMEEGALVPEDVTRDLMMDRYKEYYDQNYYNSAAQRALGKLQREEEKAAKREGRVPNPQLWEDDYKKTFEEDFLRGKQSKAAEKALEKLQKQEERAAKREGREKNTDLWSDEYKEDFVKNYIEDKKTEDAREALGKLQKREEESAENEARPKDKRLWSEEYQKEFISNYLANQERSHADAAANVALNLAASEYLDPLTDMQVHNAVKDKQKEAENTCRMYEAMAYMTNANFEYLTRGATLSCTCGAMWRRLNLPNSHGVFYGAAEDPVINKEDNQVGDNFNITNFGLCSGANPPSKRVELEDMVFTDEMGRFIASQEEDTIKRGYGCVPEIIQPGWQNTSKRIHIGDESMDAVSTRSFLVCIHGGIIYPINSGQHSNLMNMQEDDVELNNTFNQLCTELRGLREERNEILSRAMNYDQEQRLYQILSEEEACRKKMESCMDRARGDGYQKEYEDIPTERRDTINHMLEEYTKLNYGENVPSLKSDYYSFRRRNGYTTDSNYYNDAPGYPVGSDSYTDWRAGRLENMEKKEAKAEFRAWEADVDSRGYAQLTEYEKEEYDKAKKKYGK